MLNNVREISEARECASDDFGVATASLQVTLASSSVRSQPMPAQQNMPAHHKALIGAPCWIDLMTSDTIRARDFYSNLFGWTADEPNPAFGGYFNFRKDGALVAGCMAGQPGAGQPDVWSIYLATDDATKTVALATANGGQIYVEPMPVADLGTMAVVGDPAGGTIGVWQPGTHAGFGIVGEPGTPSWFELHTRRYDDAVSFYRQVFRWNTNDVSQGPDFRYTLVVDGDQQLAGVMDASAWLPEGAPAQWSIYFGVDNVDATLTKVATLGGEIVRRAEDTPYGRLAEVTDATGAVFKLRGPNAANLVP